MSRHRGAKPPRRYGRSEGISLLSPEYLLSVERWPFHLESTGSLSPAFTSARLIGLAVELPYALALYVRLPTALREPLDSSVTLLEEAAPAKLPAYHCPDAGLRLPVRILICRGWYFTGGSALARTRASEPPTYPTHYRPRANNRLQ